MRTPDLAPRKMKLSLEYANKLLGMDYTAEQTKELLEKMRYGVELKGKELTVSIPAYRADILHPIDLVEDIAIAHGYENFKPEVPETGATGQRDPRGVFEGSARELLIGFGFQEVMTLILTNEEDLFKKMQVTPSKAVETKNPVSTEHSIARTWLLPSILSVLEKNKNREYPQKIFEIGYCINPEGRDLKKLAGAIAHSKTSFSEMKTIYTGILEAFGLEYKIESFAHPSFIPGRCAKTEHGFFGEIHPQSLENFGLEVPATAFEIGLDQVFESP